MTDKNQSLAERAAARRVTGASFSAAAIKAMQLAELFEDIKPEVFQVPISDTLGGFRPVDVNRMLVRAPA